MNPIEDYVRQETRRQFLSRGSNAVGWAALAALLGREGLAPAAAGAGLDRSIGVGRTHFPPKAKHVIYLHMVGGPSQMDLYDYKPQMKDWYDKDLPDSVRMGQRLTTMTSGRSGSRSPRRSTSSPSTASAACGSASCCPTRRRWSTTCASSAACTPRPSTTSRRSRYMQTGNQVTGRPCLGAWASYGLGSLNDNLPTFVVLVAKPTNTEQVQAISARLWSVGLPARASTPASRSAAGGDPILFINNPPGVRPEVRRSTLDGLNARSTR